VNPALATERKTPLKESAPSPSGRSQTTPQRSQVARRRAIIGGAGVLLLLAIIAFFVTRNGGGIPFVGDSTGPAPAFAFKMKGVSFVSIEKDASASEQHKAAQEAADGVEDTLDHLYSSAFVNSETWGDAGAIDEYFTGGAADQIESHLDALTLGKDAGDTYTYVDPGGGTLSVKVLTNGSGDTLRAFARTTFVATATHKDGSFTKITVTGAFFLVKDGDTWKVESFDVNRAEKATKAPAASASSPSEAGQ
jgi:hypothetical protein